MREAHYKRCSRKMRLKKTTPCSSLSIGPTPEAWPSLPPPGRPPPTHPRLLDLTSMGRVAREKALRWHPDLLGERNKKPVWLEEGRQHTLADPWQTHCWGPGSDPRGSQGLRHHRIIELGGTSDPAPPPLAQCRLEPLLVQAQAHQPKLAVPAQFGIVLVV